jgi:hypothetical protein
MFFLLSIFAQYFQISMSIRPGFEYRPDRADSNSGESSSIQSNTDTDDDVNTRSSTQGGERDDGSVSDSVSDTPDKGHEPVGVIDENEAARSQISSEDTLGAAPDAQATMTPFQDNKRSGSASDSDFPGSGNRSDSYAGIGNNTVADNTISSVSSSADSERLVALSSKLDGGSSADTESGSLIIDRSDNLYGLNSDNSANPEISLDKESYSVGDDAEISLSDATANLDPASEDTIQVLVTSTVDQSGTLITLHETGPDSGKFVGSCLLSVDHSTDNVIQVSLIGDKIQVVYGAIVITVLVEGQAPIPLPIGPSPGTITPVTAGVSAPTVTTSSSVILGESDNVTLASTINKESPGLSTAQSTHSGNRTILVFGEGNITLSFENLVSAPDLRVSPVKEPSSLVPLHIKSLENQKGIMLRTLNNERYRVVGTVFNIGPSDIKLNDTLIVKIPYNSVLAPQGGDSVRMFHYTGTFWEDVTSLPGADGHLVTGRVSSLGPVVAATRA